MFGHENVLLLLLPEPPTRLAVGFGRKKLPYATSGWRRDPIPVPSRAKVQLDESQFISWMTKR